MTPGIESAQPRDRPTLPLWTRRPQAVNDDQATIACSANADAVSKQVFEALVGDEESHYDAFDKQLENIKRFGPSYLALQSFGHVTQEASAPAEAE